MILVIDGNAFINVAISVTKAMSFKDKNVDEKYYVEDLFNEDSCLLKEHIQITFRNFCLNYLSSLIAPIGPSLSGVHFVFDSKSWRKEYIENFFKTSTFESKSAPSEFTYKGKRKYDDHQYLFFDYFQKSLLPVLQERCGVNYYRFKDAEGDDIIAYLCDFLNDDILIYSVDKDIIQLINNSKKNILLIVPKQMSKHKKVYVPTTFVSPIKEESEPLIDDFFSLPDSSISVSSTIEKLLNNIVNKGYVEYRVDSTSEIVDKILGGDKSDNISKLENMGPVKRTKLFNILLEKYKDQLLSKIDSLDEELISFIIDQIAVLNKIKDPDKLRDLRKHLLFNIRIIRLSTNFLPDELQKTLISFFKDNKILTFNSKEFNSIKNNPTLL